jgi:DNA ligase-1
MLNRIKQFIDQSNATNSNSDKLQVIRSFSDDSEVMQALRYTYTPFKQYYVTSKNCKKRSDLVADVAKYHSLFDLLDALALREITGHDAISAVNRFISDNRQYEDLIFNIIDRNLKTRSTTSMINKIVPGLIPTFDVALADTYKDSTKKKVDLVNDSWYVSRKLDGVRCIAYIDESGEPKFFSRSGKEFNTLGKVAEQLKKYGLRKIVLDGEICMVDEAGNEDFQGIIKEIKRKDHTIQTPKFLVFDILHQDEFDNKVSDRIFSERQDELETLFDTYDFNGFIDQVHQFYIDSEEDLQDHMDTAVQFNWEGLMLRKDAPYQGKRSSDIMKVKKFFDAEYVVVDVENAINRVIVDGREVEEEMLRNVVIEHKGNMVQVGSGFTQDQKRYYYQNPEEILGKTINVQYFEESQSQSGEYSLRFPVIKAIYENGRQF